MLIAGTTMSMHEPIRDHLAAIDAARDVARLLGATARPEGTHPMAREWVRRWGPAPALAAAADCACAAGRCTICN